MWRLGICPGKLYAWHRVEDYCALVFILTELKQIAQLPITPVGRLQTPGMTIVIRKARIASKYRRNILHYISSAPQSKNGMDKYLGPRA